jgi:hypothetical protein
MRLAVEATWHIRNAVTSCVVATRSNTRRVEAIWDVEFRLNVLRDNVGSEHQLSGKEYSTLLEFTVDLFLGGGSGVSGDVKCVGAKRGERHR